MREIVREPQYEASIADIAPNYARLDELEAAIDWALARDPTRFYNIAEDFYLWKMEQMSDDIPSLLILYRYNPEEDVIHLLDVCEPSSASGLGST